MNPIAICFACGKCSPRPHNSHKGHPALCLHDPANPIDIIVRATNGCPAGYYENVPHDIISKMLGLPEPAAKPWPWIVRIVARWRIHTDAGIGDTLERAFAAIGGELVKEAMKATGADCGCDGRQKWLNARFPY